MLVLPLFHVALPEKVPFALSTGFLNEPPVHANTTGAVLLPAPDFVPLTAEEGQVPTQKRKRGQIAAYVPAVTTGSGRVRPLK